jgi:hypothetical protein
VTAAAGGVALFVLFAATACPTSEVTSPPPAPPVPYRAMRSPRMAAAMTWERSAAR